MKTLLQKYELALSDVLMDIAWMTQNISQTERKHNQLEKLSQIADCYKFLIHELKK